MNKIDISAIAATVVFASSLLLGSGPLHANPSLLRAPQPNLLAKADPAAPAKKPKKASASKPGKVKKQSTRLVAFPENERNKHGSRETEFERSERLSRECRGGVNAGACAGYTR